MSKYSEEELGDMAKGFLSLRGKGKQEYDQLLQTMCFYTGLSPEAVIKKIESFVDNMEA